MFTKTSADTSENTRGYPALHMLSAPLWCKFCQEEWPAASHWKSPQCGQFPMCPLWKEFWEERSHEATRCQLWPGCYGVPSVCMSCSGSILSYTDVFSSSCLCTWKPNDESQMDRNNVLPILKYISRFRKVRKELWKRLNIVQLLLSEREPKCQQ